MTTKASVHPLKRPLEALYRRFNDRRWVHPDPLAPVYRFTAPEDQEIAALVSASLAFGNVKTILNSVDVVLTAFPRPRADLMAASDATIARRLRGFRHRYVTDVEMAALLRGAREAIAAHDGLGNCFAHCGRRRDPTVLPALSRFIRLLRASSGLPRNYLLPDPADGSACKRMLMYLRWMTRLDRVDLGIWRDLSPARLVAPMDVHLHRMARRLGFTDRKTPDLRAALEVTAAFRAIAPRDPIRYDFALTRLGIRAELDPETFLVACQRARAAASSHSQ